MASRRPCEHRAGFGVAAGAGRIGLQNGGQFPGARNNPGRVLAPFEMWHNFRVLNFAAQRVGQEWFDAVPNFDPHPPLVGGNQKQHAVVGLATTDSPASKKDVGVRINSLPFQRTHRHDRDLGGCFSLDFLRDALQRLPFTGREQIREIMHAPIRILGLDNGEQGGGDEG